MLFNIFFVLTLVREKDLTFENSRLLAFTLRIEKLERFRRTEAELEFSFWLRKKTLKTKKLFKDTLTNRKDTSQERDLKGSSKLSRDTNF